ncbi:hypothetical protein ACL9RL_03225 [Plantibacter sp. Mn2098]|uniref:hypothetical protein n=1 Tax=Plantibacter sp. Mn2098 TaxID=3395266 RepID=UPI003BCD2A64
MPDDSTPRRGRPEWFGWLILAGLLAVLALVALLIGGPETPILWGMVSGVLLSLVIAAMTAFRSKR